MVKTWTPQHEMLMIKKLLEVHDLSINYAAVAKALAEIFGEEVTAKAVQHRFAAIRSMSDTIAAPAAKKTPTPKKPKAPKANMTPKGKSPAAKKPAKRSAEFMEGDDIETGEENCTYGPKKLKTDHLSTNATAGFKSATPEVDDQEAVIPTEAATSIERRLKAVPYSPSGLKYE